MSGIPPTALLLADVALLGSIFSPVQWGIFDQSGIPIIAVGPASMVEINSTAAMEYKRDYRISNYPQEQGAFESYNKVQVPYQAVVSFFVSTARFDFLANIEAAVGSLNLFVVAVPEWSYQNANLTHYSYRREARRGVTMFRVDVWCEEVRVQNVSPGAMGQINQSNTASTNAATPVPSGNVQIEDLTLTDPATGAEVP